MRVLVAHRCDGPLSAFLADTTVRDYEDAARPTLETPFRARLGYPADRRLLNTILAKYPDKNLEVLVEAIAPLDFPVVSLEGITYYKFGVSLVRRRGLDRYLALRSSPQSTEPVTVRGCVHPTAACRQTLSSVKAGLLERRWIANASVANDYVYHEPYLRILDAFRVLYQRHVCRYPRCRLPSLVSNQTLCRTGLAGTLTHQCMHIVQFPERKNEANLPLLNRISVMGLIERPILQGLKPKGVHLSHNCCLGLWPSLENLVLDEPLMAVSDLDGVGFRNEGGSANGRERFEAFRRIETVFLGRQDAVSDAARALECGLSRFLECLGLDYRILRVTPWYGKVGDKVTHDWQVPVGTGLSQTAYVQVANLTEAGSIFTDCYGLKGPEGERLVSGCSGLGLERLVSVFLATHGFDVNDWPSQVRVLFKQPVKDDNL